jgi:hypothetical protein
MSNPEVEFDWVEANIGHVARHNVLPEESEQVILSNPVDVGVEIIEGEERCLNLGANSARTRPASGDYLAEDRVRVVNGIRTNQTAHSVLLSGTRKVIHDG